MGARFLAGIALLLVLFLTERGQSHQVSSVSLISHLDTEKRTYLLDAAMEVVPSIDQAVNDQISPEDAAREFAKEYLEILFDEKKSNRNSRFQLRLPAMKILPRNCNDSRSS